MSHYIKAAQATTPSVTRPTAVTPAIMQKKQMLPKERVAVLISHLPLDSLLRLLSLHNPPNGPGADEMPGHPRRPGITPVPCRVSIRQKITCVCQGEELYWNMPIRLNRDGFLLPRLTQPAAQVWSARRPTLRKPARRRPSGSRRMRRKPLSAAALQRLEQRHPDDYAQRYDTGRVNSGNYTSDTDIAERTCCRAHPAPPPRSCCVCRD